MGDNLSQIGGFLLVLRFSPPKNIVKGIVKYHNHKPNTKVDITRIPGVPILASFIPYLFIFLATKQIQTR